MRVSHQVVRKNGFGLLLTHLTMLCAATHCVMAQSPGQSPSLQPKPANLAPQADSTCGLEGSPAKAAVTEPAAAEKPSGAALRNENVFASKVDTDMQKADNVRLG